MTRFYHKNAVLLTDGIFSTTFAQEYDRILLLVQCNSEINSFLNIGIGQVQLFFPPSYPSAYARCDVVSHIIR